jgi:thiamine-phosphate pyrophosphorylase
VDTASLGRAGFEVFDFARALVDGGAAWIQFRHKGSWTRDVVETLERMSGLGATLIVNDRADMAALFGAGLHLGQDDLPVELARRVLRPGQVVGFSTHNEAQLLEADADYLALGPIFGTASKERPDPVVGLGELRRLRAMTQKPLVAIGGISRATAPAVLEAGADSVAVIGDLLPAEPTRDAVRERIREWLKTTT